MTKRMLITACCLGALYVIWWACWRELRRIWAGLASTRLTCAKCERSIGHGTLCCWHGGEPMPKHVIAALRQKRQAGDEVVETVIGTVEAPDNLHAEGKAHKIFGFHVTVRSAIEHQFVLEERSAAKRSTRPKPAHAKRA